jgi:hypothetical protein
VDSKPRSPLEIVVDPSQRGVCELIGSKAAKPLDQVKLDLENFCPPGSATCRASELET